MDKVSLAILTAIGSKGMLPITRPELFNTLHTHYINDRYIMDYKVAGKLSELILDRYVCVVGNNYSLTQRGLDFLNKLDATDEQIAPTAETTISPAYVKWVSVCRNAFIWCIKHIVWVILISILAGLLTDYLIKKYHLFQ